MFPPCRVIIAQLNKNYIIFLLVVYLDFFANIVHILDIHQKKEG